MSRQDIYTRLRAYEKELICSALTFDQHIPAIRQVLDPEDFFSYRKEYETLVDAHKNEKNLYEEFHAKGIKLSDFTEFSSRSHAAICRDVKAGANALRLFNVLSEAQNSLTHEEPEQFSADLQQKLLGAVSSKDREDATAPNVVEQFKFRQQEFAEKKERGGSLLGLSTGFNKLDEVIDGLRPGHLWIFGGYTNMGKTSGSLNILAELVRQGEKFVYYSLEMTKTDIYSRLLGILSEENGVGIMKGYPHNAERVANAERMFIESRSKIYNTKYNLEDILLSMAEESMSEKPAVFVIDFLQNVMVKEAKSEYEGTTKAIIQFQKAAGAHQVPTIVLSQVSNDSARSTDGMVMGFKGSGAIAAAADLAIEITNGEEDSRSLKEKLNSGEQVQLKWQIKKNRHGRVGYIDMLFSGRTGIFTENEI